MQKSADPLSTTLKKLASFSHGLACFGQVLQHSERSSLDVEKTLGPMDGVAIGEHPWLSD